MKNLTRRVVSFAGACVLAALPLTLKATPYASSVTVSSGTVSFYLNESGGNVVVTFEDGSTNANFDGIDTGTNVPSGPYSFSMSGHTTYAITVTKMGTGVASLEPNVIQATNTSVYSTNHVLQGFGDPRGLALNVNSTSPYFGRIYISRGGTAATQTRLYDLNPDGSWSTAGSAGTTLGISWSTETHATSPNKLSVAANDNVIVSDWSAANSGVWFTDPNLTTNESLLGPPGAGGPHGGEVGRAWLLGDLGSANGATLLTVDATYPNPYNCILVYSNITASALSSGTGWQTAPSLIGPDIAVNLAESIGSGFYFSPNLFVGTNGYLYAGEYRAGPSPSNPAGVQVYGLQITNQLWNSDYNNSNSDYFNTAASPGTACLPTDLAVSQDGKYLATVGYDNHITVCSLTNGIPDVSTIYTIKPDIFLSGSPTAGSPPYGLYNQIAWDAADNIYILTYSGFGVKAWTLGLSTSTTTVGTIGGSTSFGLTFLNPTVSVYATNPPVISQANSYGNPTNGYFTIVRSGGNLSLPLTVNISYGGTATNGTYTAGASGAVVFAAGQTVTNIPVKAVTDGIARLTTYLKLTAAASSSYTLQPASATLSILNTATPYLIPSVAAASMYNAFSNDYASVSIERLGDTNATTTVNNFTTTGTATRGTDYTTPSTVTFNPGDLTGTTYIQPLIGGQLPVHSTSLPFSGNKSVILSIGSGSGYTPAPVTNILTIVDSASPSAPVLFSDPLSDPNDAANWNIVGANGDMAAEPLDVEVSFGYDLTTVSGDTSAIPFPPNGSQYALRMTVNKQDGQGEIGGPMTAVNAYLTNQVFTGNFAIRFNMNVIETGNLTEKTGDAATSTGTFNNEEGALFGFNHNGLETNWYAADEFTPGAPEGWAADGIFFWVSDSGGSYLDSYSPYEAFVGNGSPSTNAGWALIGSQPSSNFATAFKTNVFTSFPSRLLPPYDGGWTEGGPGLAANGSANYGLSISSWSDVEIKQLDGVVTMSIDKTPIFVYTNSSIFQSGLLMLGYEDPYNGGEDTDAAVYYSNLRVVSVGAPIITGISADDVHGTVTMSFGVTDDGSTLTVQSAPNVNGPYTTVASAIVTPLGNGSFQAVMPQNGAIRFYRILQQ